MRKWIALVLAVLQIGFGGFLIANASREERIRAEQAEKEKLEDEKRINEIVANGTEFLFEIESFYYNPSSDDPESFRITLYSERFAFARDYYPLSAADNGAAVFGENVREIPSEPYLARLSGKTYYRIEKSPVFDLFNADVGDSDYHYYYRSEENLFDINGKWVSVYAVGTVYQGSLVYTGLVVDGVRY